MNHIEGSTSYAPGSHSYAEGSSKWQAAYAEKDWELLKATVAGPSHDGGASVMHGWASPYFGAISIMPPADIQPSFGAWMGRPIVWCDYCGSGYKDDLGKVNCTNCGAPLRRGR